ncbi:unnamed protein product, partial [Mesorhabditis spiculigera]
MPVLHRGAHVRLPLLELGDKTDRKSDEEENELHQHARDGNVEGLRKILEEHEELLDAKDDEGLTALHYAARYRNVQVVKMLLEWQPSQQTQRASPNAQSLEGFTPLHFAARYYRKETEKNEDESGREDQCRVFDTNDATYQIILLLKAHGGEVNAKDCYELTPLHYAAMRGSATATHALIACKCQVDPVDSVNMSPLMTACVHGAADVVEILLHEKARIDLRDKRDNTVLHLASQYGHHSVLKLLVGAISEVEEPHTDVAIRKLTFGELVSPKLPPKVAEVAPIGIEHSNLLESMSFVAQLSTAAALTNKNFGGITARTMLRKPNSEGNTPLQLAVERNHIQVVRMMLELIAITVPDGDGQARKKVTELTSDEKLLPHVAASKGFLEILEDLEMYGFNILYENEKMEIPLHLAAASNQAAVLEYFLGKYLKLDKKIGDPSFRLHNLEKCDINGMTPLLRTAPGRNIESANVLLDYHANRMASDSEGRNIIYLAAKYNNVAYLQWMLDRLQNQKPTIARKQMRSLRINTNKFDSVAGLVNSADLDQSTALHIAAVNGYLEACQILKRYGAREDALNEDKQTPLHMAAMNGHLPVVRLLLSWSAALAKAKDDDGNSPLHLAAKQG